MDKNKAPILDATVFDVGGIHPDTMVTISEFLEKGTKAEILHELGIMGGLLKGGNRLPQVYSEWLGEALIKISKWDEPDSYPNEKLNINQPAMGSHRPLPIYKEFFLESLIKISTASKKALKKDNSPNSALGLTQAARRKYGPQYIKNKMHMVHDLMDQDVTKEVALTLVARYFPEVKKTEGGMDVIERDVFFDDPNVTSGEALDKLFKRFSREV